VFELDCADLVVIAGELYGIAPAAALDQLDIDAARAALAEADLTATRPAEADLTATRPAEADLTVAPLGRESTVVHQRGVAAGSPKGTFHDREDFCVP